MPLGYNNYASSDTSRVGINFTRLRGPVLIGQIKPASNVELSAATAHVINVSTQPVDFSMAHGTQLSSTPTQGFVYITQTTSIVITSSGGGVLTTPNPAGQAGGVALVWDSGRNKLCAYSTVVGSWLTVTLTSS